LESDTLEELTDIAEVLRAIILHRGISIEDFETARLDKVYSRGAFEERIFLIKTAENNIKRV
jgi:predicted house-cleaning noncanonical NTP pyrophosphatase (MazG superfamily)